MRILVTGGAGYIGSVVAEELIREGDHVTVLDNLYQGHRTAVHPQAEFVLADLADAGAVNDLFAQQNFDAVMQSFDLSLDLNVRDRISDSGGELPVHLKFRTLKDFRPESIIRSLDLRRPIYRQTATYGHFGREDLNLPWEKTDKAEILRKEAGL